jgi:hypothetical protein
VLALCVAACDSGEPQPVATPTAPTPPPTVEASSPTVEASPPPTASPWPVPGIDDRDPIHVLVTDPRVLEHWDGARGRSLALSSVLARIHAQHDWPVPDVTGPGGDVLSAYTPTWAAIAGTLGADLERIVDELAIDWEAEIDRTYDVTAAKTPEGADASHRGNGNVARIFDARWLGSADLRTPLAAMVYRPDRADFLPGSCGELRLVYRLAYVAGAAASRLPVTVNVVFVIPDDGQRCREVARSFRAAALDDDAGAERAAASLLAGPLASERARFSQIEINAQIVRFPSDLERVEGRGFAGQALYWMRIFAAHGADRLVPVALENTPDVQRLRADPAKRARLVAQILAQTDAIDRGVFTLTEDLLATVALSWSTHGSVRLANHPFAAIFEDHPDELVVPAAVPTEQFLPVGDAASRRAALLDRLDGATCMGCHQSASTAGFHLLGVDRPQTDGEVAAIDGNRLQSPSSPHLLAEVERRRAVAEALAAGRAPERFRPHPAAPPGSTAARRDLPCPLPGAVHPHAAWSCASGLECRALAGRDGAPTRIGQCVRADAVATAGAACRAVTIASTEPPSASGLAFNVRAFTDRVREGAPVFDLRPGALARGSYDCRPPAIGVPLGRVTRRCRADEPALAGLDVDATEVCAIVGGKGFEQMATGAFDPVAFAAGVGRGLLDTCTADRPCREDYICQRLPDFLVDARHGVPRGRLDAVHDAGVGFCTPTYFVYQLRTDGHPRPR